ncbi:hypothetical protein CCACVL1_22856 [Corchorus capsularis]|uniref:Protein kinase domain-containing protein n=1 Tax=Corchorus capsularis TaxID=210143 RepID=A0A1R3GWB9_COCAP|nr:hypothetical protein CCACVL1_22856 [Corchorus capsularis]
MADVSSENCKDSEDNTEKKSEDEVVPRHRRQGAIISSTSAYELRALDKEIEKKEGLSPKGVLDACLEGLDSNTPASPVTPGTPEAGIRCTNSGALRNWRKFFRLWRRKSREHLASFPPLAPKLSRKSSRSSKENPVLRDLYNFKSSLQNFSLSELQAATDNFSKENIIGKGGYGEVFKGCLKDGKLVAIKRLIKGTADERTVDFLSELGVIAHAKPLLDENDIKQLLDPSLGDDYDEEEADRMVLTASLCIEQSPILRPQMSQVVVLLRGDDYVAECANESCKKSFQRTYSNELLDAQEYNSTKHLSSNINRLREIALGS